MSKLSGEQISRLPSELIKDIVRSLTWDDIKRLCATSRGFNKFCSEKDGLIFILMAKGYPRRGLEALPFPTLKLMARRADWNYTYRYSWRDQGFSSILFKNLVDVSACEELSNSAIFLNNKGQVYMGSKYAQILNTGKEGEEIDEIDDFGENLRESDYLVKELASHYIVQIACGRDNLFFLADTGIVYGLSITDIGSIVMGAKGKKFKIVELQQGIKSISGAIDATFFITIKGEVLVNGYGESFLGIGNPRRNKNKYEKYDELDVLKETNMIPDFYNVKDILSGPIYEKVGPYLYPITLFLKEDGNVFTAGINWFHLGIIGKFYSDVHYPERIPNLKNIVKMALGGTSCLFLDKNGRVFYAEITHMFLPWYKGREIKEIEELRERGVIEIAIYGTRQFFLLSSGVVLKREVAYPEIETISGLHHVRHMKATEAGIFFFCDEKIENIASLRLGDEGDFSEEEEEED